MEVLYCMLLVVTGGPAVDSFACKHVITNFS
jgi:hypothetical protein